MKKALMCAALLFGWASPGICSTLVGSPPIVTRLVPPAGWILQSATVHLATVELDGCTSGGETLVVPSTLDWLVWPVYFPVGEWCWIGMNEVDIDVVATVNGNTVQWSWSGDLVAMDPDVLEVVTGTTHPVKVVIAIGTTTPTAWIANP